MKKVLFLGLLCGYIGLAGAQETVNLSIKNNLAYGAMSDRGGWKMVNICTVGSGECTVGTLNLGGMQVTPVPVVITLCVTPNNQFGCQGMEIMPGEFKNLYNLHIGGPIVYIWASYNDGYKAKFQADTRKSGNLEFPRDFGEPIEYKLIQAVMR